MRKSLWIGTLALALLGCEEDKPTAPSPAQNAAPVTAPATRAPAAAPVAAEEAPVKTADGELVGSISTDYLSGQVCLELYIAGNYDSQLVFDAKRNLAGAGTYSSKPCEKKDATASCRDVTSDDGLTETVIGYYYGIELDVAKQDCDDDGGVFTTL
jgi:hypothetical protein